MKLIEQARQFWRFWTVRLAVLAGVIAGAIVNQPSILTGLIAYVPLGLRPALARREPLRSGKKLAFGLAGPAGAAAAGPVDRRHDQLCGRAHRPAHIARDP